jgi:hypothetical protein
METMVKRIKMSWPEVVGWHILPAVSKINADRPDLEIEVHRNEVHRNGSRVPLEHNLKGLFTFPVFSSLKDVGICENLGGVLWYPK